MSEAGDPSERSQKTGRLLELVREQAGPLFALTVAFTALDAWAMSSTDADYYIPDLFRPIGLGLIALFAVTAFVRWASVRHAIRTFALLVVGSILVLEIWLRYRPARDEGVDRTPDVLLRYLYRAGRHGGRNNPPQVSQFGLMDIDHAIPKPPGVQRIVVISGSIANDGSIPWEQRFWKRLEAKLVAEGRRVEVVNVSVHGYSQVQQVRLLERVGLLYQPDVVVAAYMLSSATLQNGADRRFGNSYFLFRFLPPAKRALTGSVCSLFAPFHDTYAFDLIVRNSFERLVLLSKVHGFKPVVAVLPVVESFDDPICSRIYDQVVRVARESGLPAVRVPDAFKGEPFMKYVKPNGRWDICHPNPDGHEKIAGALADAVRPMLAAPTPAASGNALP